MNKYQEITIVVETGDILTSKKGIISKSIIKDKLQLSNKIKILNNGFFESLGDVKILTKEDLL
jgi:hypothetical protein